MASPPVPHNVGWGNNHDLARFAYGGLGWRFGRALQRTPRSRVAGALSFVDPPPFVLIRPTGESRRRSEEP